MWNSFINKILFLVKKKWCTHKYSWVAYYIYSTWTESIPLPRQSGSSRPLRFLCGALDEVLKIHSNSSPLAPRSGVFRFFCGSMSFDCLSPSRRGVCIVRAGCPRASKSRVLQVLSASIKLSTSGRLPYVHLGPVQQQLLHYSLCAPPAKWTRWFWFHYNTGNCRMGPTVVSNRAIYHSPSLQNQFSPMEKWDICTYLGGECWTKFEFYQLFVVVSILLS